MHRGVPSLFGLDSTSQLFELKKSSITVLGGEEPVPTNPPHIDRDWLTSPASALWAPATGCLDA